MLEFCWLDPSEQISVKFFNRNSYIFIQGNAFEKVVCKMATILSRPQCVKEPVNHYDLIATYNDVDLDQHWLKLMARCLTAPSHYLKQFWLINSSGCSPKVNSTANAHPYLSFAKYIFWFKSNIPKRHWVKEAPVGKWVRCVVQI